MTKNEALKAAIDGKKVTNRNLREGDYVYWEDNCFMFYSARLNEHSRAESSLTLVDGWELVPEYVDFATAWKAYEAGKTIKSIPCDAEYWVTDGIVDAFTSEQIRGKWLVLEDE